MILDYFRPKTKEEALDLQIAHPNCRFLGGGSSVISSDIEYYAIDLQDLGLNQVEKDKNILSIGATATLEDILGYFVDVTDIAQALRIEGSKNQRNRATLGGLLISGDGRSPFLTCLASMKCKVLTLPQGDPIEINQFFGKREKFSNLITKLEIDLPEKINFETIARSPMDKPILCCAMSTYNDGPRLSIGGYGIFPILAQEIGSLILDEKQIISKFSLIDDQWASASFRASLIKTLTQRLLNNKKVKTHEDHLKD